MRPRSTPIRIFPSVSGKAHTVVRSICVGLTEQLGRSLLFITTNTDSHDVPLTKTHRCSENFTGRAWPKLADRIEYPKQGNSKITLAPSTPAIQPLEDGIEILLAPQANPY